MIAWFVELLMVITLITAEVIEVNYLGYRTSLGRHHFYRQERSLM